MQLGQYICNKVKEAKECSRLDNWNIVLWQLCDKKSPEQLTIHKVVENGLTRGKISQDSCALNDVKT